MLKTTMPTLKLFPTSVRLPWNGVNVPTTAASLTGIGWGDEYNRNASDRSFIANKDSEHRKSPVVGTASFCFTSGFGIKTFPNPGQVLKGQSRSQLFRDAVIYPFLEPMFFPRKPSQLEDSLTLTLEPRYRFASRYRFPLSTKVTEFPASEVS